MTNANALQRLIWKDIVMIKPLVWAAVIFTVATNLLLYIMWQNGEVRESSFVGWSIALWVIAPNFVAFGAPSLLIGTEHETGTIRWLRTLPVAWQRIADAKLCVALGALTVAWVVASLVLWLQSLGWHSSPSIGDRTLVSSSGIVLSIFCSLLMLLVALASAYLIRTPLLALFVLIPFFLFSLVAIVSLTRWLGWMDGHHLQEMYLSIGIVVAGLLGTQRLLAWHRLRSCERSFALTNVAPSDSTPQYYPTSLSFGSRPSQVVSLLWQQLRQTLPFCLWLLALAAILAIFFASKHAVRGNLAVAMVLGGVSPLFALLSASWFGAMAFYGDTVHRRCGFFADRGVSPTTVWWTRLAPPAVACLLMIASAGLVVLSIDGEIQNSLRGPFGQFVTATVVLFAFGQLVSQWAERPLLAFVAAPAYAAVSLVPVFYLLGRYNASFAVVLLAVPVLLLATWQLTQSWLDGKTNGRFTRHVLAYTAIAVLLPCLWIGLPHWYRATTSMIGYGIQLGVMR